MHSWQMAFIISGVLSFARAMAWLVFYKHPRDQKNCLKKNASTSLAVRKRSTRPTTAKMSVWQIRGPVSSGVSRCHASAEPARGTFNARIPLFMFKVYGFNLKEIAMFARMPMLFADTAVSWWLPAATVPALVWVNLIVSRKMVVTMARC